MSLGLQPAIPASTSSGLPAQPTDENASQTLSFGEVLKVEEKKLQQAQEITTSSIAALFVTMQPPARFEALQGYDAKSLMENSNLPAQTALKADTVQMAESQPVQADPQSVGMLPKFATLPAKTDGENPAPESDSRIETPCTLPKDESGLKPAVEKNINTTFVQNLPAATTMAAPSVSEDAALPESSQKTASPILPKDLVSRSAVSHQSFETLPLGTKDIQSAVKQSVEAEKSQPEFVESQATPSTKISLPMMQATAQPQQTDLESEIGVADDVHTTNAVPTNTMPVKKNLSNKVSEKFEPSEQVTITPEVENFSAEKLSTQITVKAAGVFEEASFELQNRVTVVERKTDSTKSQAAGNTKENVAESQSLESKEQVTAFVETPAEFLQVDRLVQNMPVSRTKMAASSNPQPIVENENLPVEDVPLNKRPVILSGQIKIEVDEVLLPPADSASQIESVEPEESMKRVTSTPFAQVQPDIDEVQKLQSAAMPEREVIDSRQESEQVRFETVLPSHVTVPVKDEIAQLVKLISEFNVKPVSYERPVSFVSSSSVDETAPVVDLVSQPVRQAISPEKAQGVTVPDGQKVDFARTVNLAEKVTPSLKVFSAEFFTSSTVDVEAGAVFEPDKLDGEVVTALNVETFSKKIAPQFKENTLPVQAGGLLDMRETNLSPKMDTGQMPVQTGDLFDAQPEQVEETKLSSKTDTSQVKETALPVQTGESFVARPEQVRETNSSPKMDTGQIPVQTGDLFDAQPEQVEETKLSPKIDTHQMPVQTGESFDAQPEQVQETSLFHKQPVSAPSVLSTGDVSNDDAPLALQTQAPVAEIWQSREEDTSSVVANHVDLSESQIETAMPARSEDAAVKQDVQSAKRHESSPVVVLNSIQGESVILRGVGEGQLFGLEQSLSVERGGEVVEAENQIEMAGRPKVKSEAFVVEQGNAFVMNSVEVDDRFTRVEVASEKKDVVGDVGSDAVVNLDGISAAGRKIDGMLNAVEKTAFHVAPIASDVVEQITSQMKVRVGSGETSMRIRLNPEELGTIEVQMVHTSQGVSVSFVAEQPGTGQLLESQANQLRQSLKDAGVQLMNLNVNQHSHSHPEGGGFRQGQSFGQVVERDGTQVGVQDVTLPQRVGLTSEIDYFV